MRSNIQPSTFSGSHDRVSTIGTRAGVARRQNHLTDLVMWLAAITLLVVAGFSGQTRAATDIRTAKDPVIVSLPLPSAQGLLGATQDRRAQMAQNLAVLVAETIEENPGRLVTIDPGRGKLMFGTLPAPEQAVAFVLNGDDTPALYEQAMAQLLDATFEALTATHPNAPVSVLGLPLEARRWLPASTQESNDRYQAVIDRLAAFVSTRSFILFGSRITEQYTVQRGLPEAFRLRDDRPIIFRTNDYWRILLGGSTDISDFYADGWFVVDSNEQDGESSADDELALNEVAEDQEDSDSLAEVTEDAVLQHDPFADPSDEDSSNGVGLPSLLAAGIGGGGGGGGGRRGSQFGGGGGGSGGGGGGGGSGGGGGGSAGGGDDTGDGASGGGSGGGGDDGPWNPGDEVDDDADGDPPAGGGEGGGGAGVGGACGAGDAGGGGGPGGGNGGGGDGGDGDGGGGDGGGGGGDGGGGDDGGGDGGGGDNGPDYPDVEGWTEFTASPDTHIIYVSSSTGVDSNLEYYYLPSDPEIGDDPFNPVGDIYAYETIAAAKALLRHEKPDWLLLKRGDVWENQTFGQWKKSGRAADEPMLISSYGDSPGRPWLRTGSSTGFLTMGGGGSPPTIDNVALVGIHFEAHTYNGAGNAVGIRSIWQGENFLVEDCLTEGYSTGLVIAETTNFALRRSVIVDSYSTDSHSQGIFMSNVHGVLIEENVFDHNGWNEDVPEAEPTIFNHNMYINATNTEVTVRGNISADASSHGLQLRPGGIAEDNLFVRNSIAAFVSRNPDLPSAFGILRGNVVLDGKDIDDMLPRGGGLQSLPNEDVLIENNIVANKPPGVGGGPAYSIAGPGDGAPAYNVILRNNISYNWKGDALAVSFSYDSLTVENNLFQNPAYDARIIYHNGPLLAANFSGNTYHSNLDQSEWFLVNGVYYDFDGWVALSGETGAQAAQFEFVDPGRTLATYHGSIGGSPTHEAFMAEARQQSKQNWRQAYTAQAVIQYVRAGFQTE